MAGTIDRQRHRSTRGHGVSMESGLDGRNNFPPTTTSLSILIVSMESGLDGRNNAQQLAAEGWNVKWSQWSPA